MFEKIMIITIVTLWAVMLIGVASAFIAWLINFILHFVFIVV